VNYIRKNFKGILPEEHA
jgi:serine/threonine-protein kinase ULK2